jgi:glutathione S-transferase
MDSKAIATRLEKDYPSPSLHLDSPVLSQVEQLLFTVLGPLRAVWMPRVPNILPERSAEYFERTRAEALGKPLQEYAKSDGGEEPWIEALPGLKQLGELIKKEDGPYVMGKTGEC